MFSCLCLLPGFRGALHEPCFSAHLHGPLRIQNAVKLDDLGNEPGPAGLMTGTKPGAIVAVEVFVEEDVVAPVVVAVPDARRGPVVQGWKSRTRILDEDSTVNRQKGDDALAGSRARVARAPSRRGGSASGGRDMSTRNRARGGRRGDPAVRRL